MNTAEYITSNSATGELFEQQGYLVVKQFIPRIMCEYIVKNIRVLEENSRFNFGDNQVDKAFYFGSPAITETLLDQMTPVMAETVNCELYPTYSYLRIYVKGAVLSKHTDRHSCEISATLSLEHEGPGIWPIWIESGSQAKKIELEPGDALLYKGIQVPHWRDTFDGERQVQVFLHYVKKHGQYSEFKFDKRPQLIYHL